MALANKAHATEPQILDDIERYGWNMSTGLCILLCPFLDSVLVVDEKGAGMFWVGIWYLCLVSLSLSRALLLSLSLSLSHTHTLAFSVTLSLSLSLCLSLTQTYSCRHADVGERIFGSHRRRNPNQN